MELYPPMHAPPVKLPLLYLLHCACMFLVGCCVENIKQRPSKATMCFIFILVCHSIWQPKWWYWWGLHALLARLASALSLQQPLMPTIGWLLHLKMKRRLPKVEALSLFLFYDVAIKLSQTREPAIVRASPVPGVCKGPTGSHGTNIWGCRCRKATQG